MTSPQPSPLRINTKYHWMAFMMAGFKPKATINGHEVPLTWGDNILPALPGQHQITIHVPYLWKFGAATTTVDNATGPAPVVYYTCPMWTFQRGAIGFEPQRAPGLIGMWILYGVAALALVGCCVGVALSGGGS
jgi:hypothetical protein